MVLDFSCLFGGNSCDTLPGLDPAQILPEPKIIEEPPKIEEPQDTFTPSTVVTQPPPPPVTNSTTGEQEEEQPKTPATAKPSEPDGDSFQASVMSKIFMQSPMTDWSKLNNVEWLDASAISVEAFKFDTTYSSSFIGTDVKLASAFTTSDLKFTGLFQPDKFQGYIIDDGKWSYSELKDFEQKLTDLETKGQLTPEQKKGLESLRKESSQIEAQASRFAESGLNINPDDIVDLRLKNGGQGFYDNLTKLSNTVKEQEARNLAAKTSSENSFVRDYFAKENTTETRINELAGKLIKNEYSSKEAKQKDLEEFMKLYTELGKAEKLEMKDSGIFEKIMNNVEIQMAIRNRINESQKNFLDRYNELKEREKNGNISPADKEILRKMEEQKDTILAVQERIKKNPEEAYKYYQELMIDYAEAGDYKKAAAMANGQVTAMDTAEIQERAATTDKEREAANTYTNILTSDPVLRERNKVDSKELDSWIKLKGGLDKVQQEYRLSNDVTAGIKIEMRELYTNDEITYIKYYNNSSSDYSSNYGTSGVPRPGSPEFLALTKEEQRLILGQLNTEIAQKRAVEELTSWGVPKNIAIAIVTNNTSLLKELLQNISSDIARQYYTFAGLNITENRGTMQNNNN